MLIRHDEVQYRPQVADVGGDRRRLRQVAAGRVAIAQRHVEAVLAAQELRAIAADGDQLVGVEVLEDRQVAHLPAHHLELGVCYLAARRLVRLLSYFWALAVGASAEEEPDFAAFADAIATMLR